VQTRLPNITYSKRAKWVIYPTYWLGAINFFAVMVADAYLRGQALNGYVRAGHFFVCGKGGICTEVSSFAWHFSYWQELSIFAWIGLVAAETAYFRSTGDIKRQ